MPSPPTLFTLPRCLVPALLVLVLAGCASGTKDGYYAIADARQRMEAEAEAEKTPNTTIDTQANYVKLVEQMQKNELWFASLAHIDALEQRWGVSPESTRLRADALRETDQPEESATLYKRLVGTPLEAAGYYGLGLLAGARSDYPQAARLMEQARQKTPADPVVLGDLGYALLREGRFPEARLRLLQALQLKPDNERAQLNLALYFEVRQETAQANALMDLHRMPVATRVAIREAAQQVLGGARLPAADKTSPDGTPPLTLKSSGWSGLSRTRVSSSPAQSVAGVPAPPSSEGTP